MKSKNILVKPGLFLNRQYGMVATEYALLLVLVAGVLFVDYNGKSLLELILDGVQQLNSNYIRGMGYGVTLF